MSDIVTDVQDQASKILDQVGQSTQDLTITLVASINSPDTNPIYRK